MKHADNYRKSRIGLWCTLSVLALLLPFVLVSAAAFLLPPQYENTFLGGLSLKHSRLAGTDGEKIVVIGGSGTAFGLDSPKIEEAMGMPVVNFGLYASIGTKAMMDLSLSHVGAGDIVILSPEMDPQTLSLYFGARELWQAMDGDFAMLADVSPDDFGAMAGGFWDFAAEKFRFWRTGSAPDPAGVYNRDSFNAHGDIVYSRPHNIMARGYDPTTVIDLTPETADGAFLSYVNEYTRLCKSRGAAVYFSFAPMNRAALAEGTTEDSIYAFSAYLSENLRCEILSDIGACILDWEFFYDTNFHLNDAGVQHNTARLIRDLRRAVGDPSALSFTLPEKPQRPEVYVEEEYNDTTGFFLCEDVDGVLTLTGITDAGKTQTSLTLPVAVDGIAVQTVAEGAFAGCDRLETVILPAETRITLFEDGAFAGAPALRQIRLNGAPDELLVGSGLLDGAAPAARFIVPRQYYGDYATHYFWGTYMSFIEIDEST